MMKPVFWWDANKEERGMRLVVAEGGAQLGQSVQKALARAGVAADRVASGRALVEALRCLPYDFALLDMGLPDMDAEEALRLTRAVMPQMPVIMLAAPAQSGQRVRLLDAGADDFLVAPLDMEELMARIRCVMRRLPEDPFGKASSACGPLRLYAQRSSASLHEQSVTLTHREFWLLEVLVRKKNKIVSRSELEDALYAWGDEVDSNTVQVYVHRLRRKFSPDLIQTIRGVGYQLAPFLACA
jgi:DNA-binding response OmpR family regulator